MSAVCRTATASGESPAAGRTTARPGASAPERRCSGVAALIGAVLVLSHPGGPARAHDFWLQPAEYLPAAGADIAVFLRVGHAAAPQRSQLPLRRITRFAAIDPQGRSVDLRPWLDPGGRDDDGRIRLPAGRYQLVLESDAGALSHLPAHRFNAHLEAEGLTPAQAHREATGRTGADGSERYGRVAKALVRVESGGVADGAASDGGPAGRLAEPLGLPLEIVLEQDPGTLRAPAHADLRVYRQDVPLAGALVKLARLDGAPGPVGSSRTDSAGRARLAITDGGHWLATVAWTRVLPDGSDAEYETWFSSLSFHAGPVPASHRSP